MVSPATPYLTPYSLVPSHPSSLFFFFFFNDPATTEIYTLSLHDALPISRHPAPRALCQRGLHDLEVRERSEEHTSELQSRRDLVCRLLLEKKKSTAHDTLNVIILSVVTMPSIIPETI